MNSREIARLRVLVGSLGERRGRGWWASSFFDGASEAFLAPIFGRAAGNARVVGVTEAARKIHDEAIGVGSTFHLFRLPESVEQETYGALAMERGIAEVASAEAAIRELATMAGRDIAAKSGPVHIGNLAMLADAQWAPLVAAHYRAALAAGIPAFPYFAG